MFTVAFQCSQINLLFPIGVGYDISNSNQKSVNIFQDPPDIIPNMQLKYRFLLISVENLMQASGDGDAAAICTRMHAFSWVNKSALWLCF